MVKRSILVLAAALARGRGHCGIRSPVPHERAGLGPSRADLTWNAQLYLATVPAAELNDPHRSWVSYYQTNVHGTNWQHKTTYILPAHSLVHVTVYQYDGDSGLRNPFISQATGTVGGTFLLNGKTTRAIDPDTASHVFAVPQLGVSVPLQGVDGNAKNQCANAPCTLKQRASDDLVHVPDRGQGPLPLAVLRALRSGIHLRLWRSDADRRVHGRLPEGCLRWKPPIKLPISAASRSSGSSRPRS